MRRVSGRRKSRLRSRQPRSRAKSFQIPKEKLGLKLKDIPQDQALRIVRIITRINKLSRVGYRVSKSVNACTHWDFVQWRLWTSELLEEIEKENAKGNKQSSK